MLLQCFLNAIIIGIVMILFNVPPKSGNEEKYISEAIAAHKICGDGTFTKKCNEWMEKKFNAKKILLTTSGTSALEMAAILCNVQPDDEVIRPSYTFCSTADAFVQRGCKIVFVDVRPDTMNIDEKLIEKAITEKTKVICVQFSGRNLRNIGIRFSHYDLIKIFSEKFVKR